MKNGRGWAYAGAWVGGALSVAGNIGNSFVPPDNALSTWGPNPGHVIVSAAWPLALVIVAEVVIRTRWPKAWYWICLRLIGLVPVGAVSGVVSFRHLRDLLAFFGEDTIVQILGPIAVDGLMITCAAALFATTKHRMDKEDDGQTDSVREPLAVRLAGQFATVRSVLSKGVDSAGEVVDKALGTADTLSAPVVRPETDRLGPVRLDLSELHETLDRLQREEDNGQQADRILSAVRELDTDSRTDKPLSLSSAERLSVLRQAFPDRIPLGREVKAELGISSQDTVTALLNALKMERGLPITIRKRS